MTEEDIVGLVVGSVASTAGTIWTSVGHDEVIKMDYFLGIGTLEGQMTDLLAWTTSYYLGVSLTEIKWGFYNPSEAGTKDSSYLEFTLHDIAGETFSKFLDVKAGNTLIFFLGPTSSGSLWPTANWALYKPIPENCDIQFSQTQGFTYKFAAMPIGNLTKTKMLATASKITINGLNDKNEAHGNTFEDYLKELAWKWNLSIAENPKKAGTSQIQFRWQADNADNDAAMKQFPVIIDKEKPQGLKRSGTADTKILPFEIDAQKTIAEAVMGLWQQRFVPTEEAPEKGIDKSSLLEVNFMKYEGGISIIDIKCHRKTITDHVADPFNVCIGTDKVCKGFSYRAQMAAINFKGILNVLAASKLAQSQGSAPQEAAVNGSSETAITPAKEEGPIVEGGSKQVTENMSTVSISPGIASGTNPVMDGWGLMATLLNSYKSPEFTIDIDMPYTFAFTPMSHGGLLEDSIPGNPMGGINYSTGVNLWFFWYTDPTCQEMMLVPAISTNYRITKIIHTIGLSGNTTQLSLSHLNVSKGN